MFIRFTEDKLVLDYDFYDYQDLINFLNKEPPVEIKTLKLLNLSYSEEEAFTDTCNILNSSGKNASVTKLILDFSSDNMTGQELTYLVNRLPNLFEISQSYRTMGNEEDHYIEMIDNEISYYKQLFLLFTSENKSLKKLSLTLLDSNLFIISHTLGFLLPQAPANLEYFEVRFLTDYEYENNHIKHLIPTNEEHPFIKENAHYKFYAESFIHYLNSIFVALLRNKHLKNITIDLFYPPLSPRNLNNPQDSSLIEDYITTALSPLRPLIAEIMRKNYECIKFKSSQYIINTLMKIFPTIQDSNLQGLAFTNLDLQNNSILEIIKGLPPSITQLEIRSRKPDQTLKTETVEELIKLLQENKRLRIIDLCGSISLSDIKRFSRLMNKENLNLKEINLCPPLSKLFRYNKEQKINFTQQALKAMEEFITLLPIPYYKKFDVLNVYLEKGQCTKTKKKIKRILVIADALGNGLLSMRQESQLRLECVKIKYGKTAPAGRVSPKTLFNISAIYIHRNLENIQIPQLKTTLTTMVFQQLQQVKHQAKSEGENSEEHEYFSKASKT